MRVTHHNGLYQIRGQLRAVRFYTIIFIETAAATAAAAAAAAAQNTAATAAATAKTAALPKP